MFMTIPTLPWEFYSFTWEWIQYLAFWTQFISLIKCILNSILLSPDISMRISFYFSDNIQSEIGKFFWYFSSWIFFVRLLTHSHEVHSVFIYPFMVIKVYVYLPFGFLNFFIFIVLLMPFLHVSSSSFVLLLHILQLFCLAGKCYTIVI